MFPILRKRTLSESVFELTVSAPKVARKVRAGQFLVLRVDERGERIPLTFSDWDASQGWIRFVFMRAGKTTHKLSHLDEGDGIADLTGPLGNPTEVEGLGRVVIVGGGVGAAVAFPTARAMIEGGNEVTVILGARTAGLLVLEDELRALALKELIVATDDGSAGIKGMVTAPLRELCMSGEVDHVMAVGPAVMMKFCAATTKEFDVDTTVSLNPIMVDGTGMCGACRVSVAGRMRFACVDGPDFNGHEVDFEELMSRQRIYSDEEREADAEFGKECACRTS